MYVRLSHEDLINAINQVSYARYDKEWFNILADIPHFEFDYLVLV